MSQSNVKELIPLLDDNNEMRRTVTGNYLFILKPGKYKIIILKIIDHQIFILK